MLCLVKGRTHPSVEDKVRAQCIRECTRSQSRMTSVSLMNTLHPHSLVFHPHYLPLSGRGDETLAVFLAHAYAYEGKFCFFKLYGDALSSLTFPQTLYRAASASSTQVLPLLSVNSRQNALASASCWAENTLIRRKDCP